MIALTMRAAAVAALFAAGGALAQQPARPAAPAAPAPAAAPQPAFSATHLAAAREMALTLGIDEPIRLVLDDMRAHIVNSFGGVTRPELTKDLNDVLTAMNPQIAAKREEIIDKGVQAFARRFSEAEIAETMKFLKTPVGQKYSKAQPEAFTEFLLHTRQWVGDLNQMVVANVRAEMKKKGHDL